MFVAVVWIDHKHAKLIQFSNEKMERKALESSQSLHHTHPQDGFDRERQCRKLFDRVAAELAGAAQILILGPGVAKHQLQNHLNEHFPALARRVSACETVDHPSDGEIAAFARQYFKLGYEPVRA